MPRKRKQDKLDWDKPNIKAHIERRGETLRSLGLKNGLDQDACSVALRRPFPKAELVIARFLGCSLHELWPDRYDEEGLRIRYLPKASKRCERAGDNQPSATRLRQLNKRGAMRIKRGVQSAEHASKKEATA